MAMQNGLMSGQDKKKLDAYAAVSNETGKFMSASGTWQTPKDDDSWAAETFTVTQSGTNTNVAFNKTGKTLTLPYSKVADYPVGFASRSATQTWGQQAGTCLTDWNDGAGGDLAFRKNCPNNGQVSMIIDGYVYQGNGNFQCLDTSSTFTLTETSTGIQIKNSAGTVVCTIPLAGSY